MLSSNNTKVLHIEFTSKCNLRCIYCAINQEGYVFHSLSPETIEEIIQLIVLRRVDVVSVNGHGETTTFPGWHRYCNILIENRIPLHIISNLTLSFSDEEIDTLSRFRDIEVSCDTADPELFARIRRGGTLKTLEHNVRRIQDNARRCNILPPVISFSTVVSDLTVFGLHDLVEFASELGIGYFNFCNLIKHPSISNTIDINHIATLPSEKLMQAEHEISRVFSLLKKKNIPYEFQKGLLDSVKHKQKQELISHGETQKGSLNLESPQNEANKSSLRYISPIKKGHTRNCLDPWHFCQIQADGSFLPCCWHQATSIIEASNNMEGLFNSAALKSLRWKILSGQLDAECFRCHARGTINRTKFKLKLLLTQLHHPGRPKVLASFLRGLFPDKTNTVPFTFASDWHDQETDPVTGNTWRWTSERSTCIIKEGASRLLIEIRGINRGPDRPTRVRLLINGREVDCFMPVEIHFQRSILVETKDFPDKNGPKQLEIGVDAPFIPAETGIGSTDRRLLGIQITRVAILKIGRG